ncbi:MAG: hypothetical protein HUU17_03395 [Chthonomonadales bacterium]|nr:hypothetical protein [Chthonomonadales bacterium]
MRPEGRIFDVHPLVARADTPVEITVTPLFDHVAVTDGVEYEVTYYPTEEFSLQSGWPEANKPAVVRDGRSLRFRQYLEGEQEHVFLLEAVQGDQRRRLGEFRVYSVGPDLAGRFPYKGDLHMHSSRSDGREAPAYVAASCRSIGLDFMALTDHRQYEPSLEAIAAFDGVRCDLRMYPGEEVHPPGNPVHMVNFGGRRSVNALFADEEAYRAEVAALEERLRQAQPPGMAQPPGRDQSSGEQALPPGVDPYQYASTVWTLAKIREFGGLGIFCHPYWFTGHRYAPAGALTSHIFATQPYDAYELIGGYHLHEIDSNTLQVARYHEERARGRSVPIVGVSDAHGCERGELFGWYYTIVFSGRLEFDDLTTSIRKLWSVAVEALPGQIARAYGPFRLVKYALFLMREVFPAHDELCVEEGRLMRLHAGGDPDAAARLEALGGRTDALYAKLFQI